MKNFTYYRPTSAAQAIALLDPQWGKTELLAGGTDLLDLQKEYVAQPDKVVSLGGIKVLEGISVAGHSGAVNETGSVIIGAATKLADIAANETVRKHLPALAT